MKKLFKKSIFIFRRDLRLSDNTGLIKACSESQQVIPIFILDQRQIGKENKFRSANCIQFMLTSLVQLDKELQKKKGRLYLFQGNPPEIIKQIITTEKIDAVYCNRDYTPFSLNRDEEIKKMCLSHGCALITSNDLLLNEPEDIKTGNGTPYTIFTPFFKRSAKNPVAHPQVLNDANFYTHKISSEASKDIFEKIIPQPNLFLASKGGRAEALSILKNIDQFKNYMQTHNIPSLPTTQLSAHLKFGTVSIREVYWAIRDALSIHSPLLRQLYWRDFFTHIAYQSPFIFGHAFKEKYDKLAWKNNKNDFNAWCEGKTGYPIVDAGMRQMNTTGFMHNRVRMITASFLIKDLHIDWQWGERYFAQQLVDYDPSVNNGNWQWVASTGADSQPYFRIFNPWLQQKKFDAQCFYIKKWVPELKNIDPKIIHTWFAEKHSAIKNYPRPIVDHEQEAKNAKLLYKKLSIS